MNAFKATETLSTRSRTLRTTTLYDLLNELNTKFFGPQWEHITYTSKEPLEDGHLSLAAQKVNQMFESGQIKFKKSQSINECLVEIDESFV
jgi:hypothetical protein